MSKPFAVHEKKVDGKNYFVGLRNGRMILLEIVESREYWTMGNSDDQLKLLVQAYKESTKEGHNGK